MDRIEGWAVNEQREMPERGWSGQKQRVPGGGPQHQCCKGMNQPATGEGSLCTKRDRRPLGLL